MNNVDVNSCNIKPTRSARQLDPSSYIILCLVKALLQSGVSDHKSKMSVFKNDTVIQYDEVHFITKIYQI
jgi:hypothetical protein